jgi:DNA/RNA endonuclease YhcR with UshA esterase domain
MKPTPLGVMLLALCVFIRPSFAQKLDFSKTVLRYDVSKEAKFQGVIGELKDRPCPISGEISFHFILQIGNQTYEVHVAPIRFAKIYKSSFHKGDAVEIIGVETQFRGADAILAREIKHGEDTLLFRDENGKPMW